MRGLKSIFILFLGFSSISIFSQQIVDDKVPAQEKSNTELEHTNDLEMEVDVSPSFPNLNQYLSSKIIYPQSAIENGEEGKVYLSFIVEKDGSVSNVRIVKSSGYRALYRALDHEAIRVLSQMPPWKPGIKNGQPVRTKFQLPVFFQLM